MHVRVRAVSFNSIPLGRYPRKAIPGLIPTSDAAGEIVEIGEGSLRREARSGLGEADLVPHQVHQVDGIFPVVDRESRIEPDLHCIIAQQFRADGVERAGPTHALGQDPSFVAQRLGADALDPAGHLRCGPPGEGHKQDAARRDAADDEMRDAMRQRVSFPRSSPGDDQKRPGLGPHAPVYAILDRAKLLGIEFGEKGRACRHLKDFQKMRMPSIRDSRFVRKGFAGSPHLA